MKIKIRYSNTDFYTSIKTDLNFVDFIRELFKKDIYCSIPSNESVKIAINTKNILTVEEDKTEE